MGNKKTLPKGIRVRNGLYEARCTIDGTAISVSGKDLNDVIERFERKKRMHRIGNNSVDPDVTYKEFQDMWLEKYKSKQIKEASLKTTARRLNRTFGNTLGDEKMCNITAHSVQNAIDVLVEEGIASSTICSAASNLKQIFDLAVGLNVVSINPMPLAALPKKYSSAEEEFALTPEEQRVFLSGIKEDNFAKWYYEMFVIMFETGIRVGEVGGITTDDIDFKGRKLYIRKSLKCNYYGDKDKDMYFVKEGEDSLKAPSSHRVIPMTDSMIEAFKNQLVKRDACKKKRGDRYRSKGEFEDVVFISTLGSPATRYLVEKEIRKRVVDINRMLVMKAKMENEDNPFQIRMFHPHIIRHTFASRCCEKGIDMKVCQKLMGHKNIKVTMDIYTHVTDEMAKKQFAENNGIDATNGVDEASDDIKEFMDALRTINTQPTI